MFKVQGVDFVQAIEIANRTDELISGGRQAIRTAIWNGYAYYLACVVGKLPLGSFKACIAKSEFEVRGVTQFKADGESFEMTKARERCKGTVSRTSKLAILIGQSFAKMFSAQLAQPWRDAGEFIQACFTWAEHNNVTSVAMLSDWAVYNDPRRTRGSESQKSCRVKISHLLKVEKEAAEAVSFATFDLDRIPAPLSAQAYEQEKEFNPSDLILNLSKDEVAALKKALEPSEDAP